VTLGLGSTVTVGYPAVGVEDSGTTLAGSENVLSECLRETSLLYLLLTLGTAWLGLSLYNFTKTYDVIADFIIFIIIFIFIVFA